MSSKVRSYALNLLARREHSKLELRQKLGKKDFSTEEIEKVIRTLTEQGLQSDERFTESYINMRSRKGFGPTRIRMELSERGITEELIAIFLNENDRAWFDLAKTVNYKKFGDTHLEELQQKAKQMRYLYYKGFTSDQIKNITHEKN